jgi:hypothetical protein
MLEEGWAVGDWIVGLEISGYTDDAKGRTRYATLLPGDAMPGHRALGMVEMIREQLDIQGLWEREGD